MAKSSVFCIAYSETQAINIVNRLKTADFSHNDISVLLPNKSDTKNFAHEQNTKTPEGATTETLSGGLLRDALDWLMGIGALAIPSVGPFIATSPIMTALSSAAVGETIGGITGTLIGMNIPEYEAKRYKGKIHKGNILISVHSDNHDQTRIAKEIFKQAKAKNISSTGEASVKDKNKADAGRRV